MRQVTGKRSERAQGLGEVRESFREQEAPQLTPKGVRKFGHPEKGWEVFPTRGYSKSKDIKGQVLGVHVNSGSHERCLCEDRHEQNFQSSLWVRNGPAG